MDRFEAVKSLPLTSALLEELLREKRAAQSSSLTSKPTSTPHMELPANHRQQSSGLRDRGTAPSEMGFREMDDHINKIKKENIGLRFELHHQRQRAQELEVKLKKMGALKDDIKSSQAINEELLGELEKRDAAVKEAVDLICQLQGTIESLRPKELNNAATQTSIHNLVDSKGGSAKRTPIQTVMEPRSHRSMDSPSHVVQNETTTSPSAPTPRVKKEMSYLPERIQPPWRTASILREQKENTQALYSLYQIDGKNSQPNPSAFSLSLAESLYDEYSGDPDRQMVNSSRLSVLSESSLFSIYGKPKIVQTASPQKIDTIYDESSHEKERLSPKQNSQDRGPNVAEMRERIDDKNKQTTPIKKLQQEVGVDKFSSIDKVIEKAPVPSHERQVGPSSPGSGLSYKTGRVSQKIEEDFSRKDSEVTFFTYCDNRGSARKRRDEICQSLHRQSVGLRVLPPTPTPMNTNHRETDRSVPNIIAERSLVGSSSFRPESLHYDIPASHQTRNRTRPHLSTYATDVMFNGHDDFISTQPARTMPYPSPTEGKRRRSVHFPPVGNEASMLSNIRTPSVSLQKPTEEACDTPTPAFGPSSHRPDSRLPQSSSTRFKDLLFGRSNSQAARSSADAADLPSARPKSSNVSSPSHQRRSSSIHFANTSKPLPDPTAQPKIGRSASAKMKDRLRGFHFQK